MFLLCDDNVLRPIDSMVTPLYSLPLGCRRLGVESLDEFDGRGNVPVLCVFARAFVNNTYIQA